MIKYSAVLTSMLVASAAAFLSAPTTLRLPHTKISHSVLKATKLQDEGIPKTPAACLERDYRQLQEKLRHDLLQLKHQQMQVALEEEELLKETMEVTEFERFGQELEVASKQEELNKAHAAVEAAQRKKKQAYVRMEEALANAQSWKNSVDSDQPALDALHFIETAAKELREAVEELQIYQRKEKQAIRLETGAEVLLHFLEEQEDHLKIISSSNDPKVLDQWSQEETKEHHHAVLQASSMEWEYQKLRLHLQNDLLDLQHQREQVLREEQILATKAAELLRLKEVEETRHATEAFGEMKKANHVLQKAVEKKDKAYQATLWALDEVVEEKDDIDDVDRRALELWFVEGDDEKYLDSVEENLEEAKEAQFEAIEREISAEELLLRLKQKEEALKELRQPGQEKELEAWVRNEMMGDQSILRGLRKTLPDLAAHKPQYFPRWD